MKNEPTNTPWLYDKRPAADQGRDTYHENRDAQGLLVALPEKEGALTDYERLLQGLYEVAQSFVRSHGDDMAAVRHTLVAFVNRLERQDPKAAHQIREGIRHAQKPSQNPCKDDSMEGREKPQAFGLNDRLEPMFEDASAAEDCFRAAERKIAKAFGWNEERFRITWETLVARGQLTADDLRSVLAQTTPPAHDFTDEEIEAVRRMTEMGRTSGISYSKVAASLMACDSNSFYWRDSPEGRAYWKSVTRHDGAAVKDWPMFYAITTVKDTAARAKLRRYAAIAQHLAETEKG